MNNRDNFFVAKYEKENLEDIVQLWRDQYPQDYIEKRKILFKWLTEGNPYNIGEGPYYLLFKGRKVVGMHGHMPLKFSINGKRKKGFLAHDDFVSCQYRGKGLGKIMLNGVAEKATSFAGAMWFNDANHRLYLKSGWIDVPNFYPFVKIFNPEYFLKKKVRNEFLLKMISKLIKIIIKTRDIWQLEKKSGDIQILEINRFDDSFDTFFEEISSCFCIIAERNQRYLNWKFIEKPFNKYKIYKAIDRKDKLLGYIVIKTEEIENDLRGKIIDTLVNPSEPKAFNALIKKSIQVFSEMDVSYVEIIISYQPFLKLLKKLGFIKGKNFEYFMIINWEDDFKANFIKNINNWYLTYSDADGDAWKI